MNLRPFILILLISFLIMGCSKGGISPIVPSENNATSGFSSDDLRTLAVDQTVIGNYWAVPLFVDGEIWASNYNENGTLHRAIGPGVDAPDPIAFVNENPEIFLVSPDDLIVLKDEYHDGIRYLIYGQTYNGILVATSRVDFRYSRNGKLVMIGSDVFPFLNVSTTPSISAVDAYNVLISDAYEEQTPEYIDSKLVIYPVPENGTLAWRIDAGDWRIYIDAHDGFIIERVHYKWEASYTAQIDSNVKMTSPLDEQVPVPGSYSQVEYRSGTGWLSSRYGYGYADIHGESVFVSTRSSVYEIVSFYSPWANVSRSGTNSTVVRQVEDGSYTTTNWTDANSLLSERMVFYFTNHARDYLKNIDPTNNVLDFRIAGNVHGNPLCNAYATRNSINFFRPDGGCADTGHVPDVIIHEHGHVFTFRQYTTRDCPGDLHEGYSDYWGCTITDQPSVGKDIQGQGTRFRTTENNLKWPAAECGDSVHCRGMMLSGSFWKIRNELGRDYSDYLFVFSRYGEPTNFHDFPPELLILDDDNDNPLDGTPNYATFVRAFWEGHNIEVPAAPDLPTSNLTLDIWPAKPPVKISAADGGSFQYNLRLTNHENYPIGTQVWASIYVPWLPGFYGPIIPPGIQRTSPVYVQLLPQQTVELKLTQLIPAGQPSDTYKYHVRIGNYGGQLTDDRWFDIVLE